VSATRGNRPPPAAAPDRSWTVLELLRWTSEHFAARGIEGARLDAECLLSHALGVPRLRLYLDFEKPVLPAERAVFRELVRRRADERVPVSLLIGEREFWSLPIRVTEAVLTPRPETETLVSVALDRLPEGKPLRVLEIGTGSGAVALALAKERPEIVLTATDISQEALKVAQENAERLDLAGRIRWLQGDGLDPVKGESFDLVVSNPPYVAEEERAALPPELAHEPDVALFGGPDGTQLLRRIALGVGQVLALGGWLALEHGPTQGAIVASYCREAGLVDVATRRDLAERPRVTSGRRPGDGEKS
jgi:release factor glutamine methyltransferase